MSERDRTREQLWRSIAARSLEAAGDAAEEADVDAHAHAPAADFELLARWRGGERTAGEALCRRHYGTLIRFFATKCRRDAAALAAQTLLASVRDPDTAQAAAPADSPAAGGEAGRGSFRVHLFALARRELHRHLQQRRREPLDLAVASIEEILATRS
jgi:RNA polymerase sigma-70 factor (ECF subfamily)